MMVRYFLRAKEMLRSFSFALLCLFLGVSFVQAADQPLIRIAHGAFNEKVAALWIGVEQGFFRKHGLNVEVINIRSGPLTMVALASGDIQVAYTIPGAILSAAAGGMDVAFFGGIVNRADGDLVVEPSIRRPEDLRGKTIGVQSIGGGVWALESVAFIQNPARREVVIRSLAKNLRLQNLPEAESGYQVLQWIYSFDIRPNIKGIEKMHRLLSMTNPKLKGVKPENVVDEGPV